MNILGWDGGGVIEVPLTLPMSTMNTTRLKSHRSCCEAAVKDRSSKAAKATGLTTMATAVVDGKWSVLIVHYSPICTHKY